MQTFIGKDGFRFLDEREMHLTTRWFHYSPPETFSHMFRSPDWALWRNGEFEAATETMRGLRKRPGREADRTQVWAANWSFPQGFTPNSLDAPASLSMLASTGGFVITNAATGGGDVKALVYVDAFIPEEGEVVFQILGGSGSALDVPDPTTVLDLAGYPGGPEGDVEAFLKPDTVHKFFAQDLSEADRALIAAGQRPITLSANTTPSLTAAWKTLPSWAVVGTEDLIIPPDTQRRMAERAGATITEVADSHVSMVSHAQVTIDAILAAVAAVGD